MRTNKNQEKNQDNAWFGQTYNFYSFLRRKKNKSDINQSKAELSGLTYVKNSILWLIKKSQFQNIITAFKSELQQMQTNICQMKTCNPD